MVAKEVMVHMNAGNDDTSYANNSVHQKIGISRAWHIVDETLKDMFSNGNFPSKCFRMADLGCSSGPNTLFVVSHIIEKIEGLCTDISEVEVFLNDLPENDFNNMFKLLPSFYEKLNNDHEKNINFVYSSYSLQWLSQLTSFRCSLLFSYFQDSIFKES